MNFIRVLGGDFRTGIVFVEERALKLKNLQGQKEELRFEDIVSVRHVDSEKRTTAGDTVKGLAAGGVLGGVAAGALAGGLTGPAGAILGAAAGAVMATRRTFLKSRVELRDGRWFIAEGRQSAWLLMSQLVAEAGRSP